MTYCYDHLKTSAHFLHCRDYFQLLLLYFLQSRFFSLLHVTIMAVSIYQDSIDAMLAFNHLMNRLTSVPVSPAALRGILAVSKLRLIREVLEELDLNVNGPEVMLKGNNAVGLAYPGCLCLCLLALTNSYL